MLNFKLIKKENELVEYRYYPEKSTDYGTVTASTDGELISIDSAVDDEFNTYALHLLSRIRKFAKDKSFDEEGMIAWY